MAQKTIVELTDDIDGTQAAETVRFALDGVAYEIDLSESNAATLRDSIARFVQHARKAGATGAAANRRQAASSTGYDPSAVRAWAASNGVNISARGRIPSAVLAQYRAAGN